MNLLLNGCSFSDNYYLVQNLAKQLGYDQAISLSKGGSSNRRIVRTTVEYLETHDDIGFVLLGLTFLRRHESALVDYKKDQDRWIQYGSHGLQYHYLQETDTYKTHSLAQVEKFVQNLYDYDIDITYADQLITDLIMLSGYLKERQINHLFFNFCEYRYKDYFDNVSPRYQKIAENNLHIVPLDQFNANLFLRDHGAKYAEPEARWPEYARHYNGEEYIHLNNYFMRYLENNKLL